MRLYFQTARWAYKQILALCIGAAAGFLLAAYLPFLSLGKVLEIWLTFLVLNVVGLCCSLLVRRLIYLRPVAIGIDDTGLIISRNYAGKNEELLAEWRDVIPLYKTQSEFGILLAGVFVKIPNVLIGFDALYTSIIYHSSTMPDQILVSDNAGSSQRETTSIELVQKLEHMGYLPEDAMRIAHWIKDSDNLCHIAERRDVIYKRSYYWICICCVAIICTIILAFIARRTI